MSDRALTPSPARPEDCLAGGGEMGALMRSVDWSLTPLGAVAAWPQSLRTTISIMLESRFAMVVAWGADFRFFYNDRYRPVLGATKHPGALGKPGAEIFPEVWPVVGPEFERVRRGQALAVDDWFLPLDRNGYLENCWFTLSYSPIRDETGGVGGVLAVVAETTGRVEGERRLATLRELARKAADAKSPDEACRGAAAVLEDNPIDVPFAVLHLMDDDGRTARRVCAVGLPPGPLSRPETLDLDVETDWPLARAAASGEAQVLTDLGRRFGALPGGPYPEPTHTAVVLPLSRPGLQHPYGLLVAGISPRRAIDDRYRGFLDLVADHIATAISNARAFEAERQRAEALAEIDRAKTAFFSNVSHEFRTPLTLILGPIEDALAAAPSALAGDALGAVHRNALRLLRLVNTLLDFSRIEAGRHQAVFAPTDLAALTADTASGFRGVIERAGLALTVRAPALPEPAFVDRDMWEKILLNLLSNAFKFTFHGGVTVVLRESGTAFELEVTDTGTGIPESELPRVFERFHRVDGARSRSHEGSGIGLALVRELARMHGGDVRVASAVGRGTTFTVTIPRGSAHLAADRVAEAKAVAPRGATATAFVEEALRWIGDEPPPAPVAAAVSARILVADDNADMRAYLLRILGAHWTVEAVADGAAAVAAARAVPPDLVMTDVMMPGLDGFGVLRALRADARTAPVPVVMLSARAGEEASVEGLAAGADDYLVKPFSARELVARVRVHLDRVQARRAADEAGRAKDEFLAMLGHELRNPLSPIVTALQIIRLRGSDPSAGEHAIIERQVQHMVRLVDDLLDVSRITEGKVELKRRPVELGAVVAKAVETVSPLLEKRAHRLTVTVPAEGLRVNGDEFRLSQVVANLVGNAAKYSPEGGAVVVTGAVEGGDVVLTVKDSGIGIDAELLPRIFDAFTQGKRSRDRSEGGLGLGLAIARSLVVMHGGTIRAASAGPGKGAQVTVRLPRAVEEAAEPTPATRGAPAPEAVPRRILIVDDNLDGAELMREVLRIAGHETRYALDGPSAMLLAADFHPEVAFLDIGLPVMDGYELARRLRESRGADELKLVAVTGYGQEADKRRSREAGFVAHVVKPVDFGQLRILLDDLFAPPGPTPPPPSP